MTIHVSARIAWHMDGWNGRIGRDQVVDYSTRRVMSVETMERQLASQLEY